MIVEICETGQLLTMVYQLFPSLGFSLNLTYHMVWNDFQVHHSKGWIVGDHNLVLMVGLLALIL
jgi:hypothetical protein